MKKLFIIPFRDRESQRCVFINHMQKVLEDEDYEFIFVHQKDKRTFNRGGLKNIGFLYAKKTYPHDYKKMTFIFHDIDTVPYKKGLFDYETTEGIVKHYFGFKFALGGMFAIKGSDFEKIYGFPNFWGWGFEDNNIQLRWSSIGGKIDRRQFFPIGHKNVVGFHNSARQLMVRQANKKNVTLHHGWQKEDSGFHTIKDLHYEVENMGDKVKMLHVSSFLTETIEKLQIYETGIPRRAYRDHKVAQMGEIIKYARHRRR